MRSGHKSRWVHFVFTVNCLILSNAPYFERLFDILVGNGSRSVDNRKEIRLCLNRNPLDSIRERPFETLDFMA